MNWESALQRILEADDAVGGLVGKRIFWTSRPQKTGYPVIVLEQPGSALPRTMGGLQGFVGTLVQINCMAMTHEQAAALRDAVIACLTPGHERQGIRFGPTGFENIRTRGEDVTGGGFAHRHEIDARIWHTH